MYKHTQIGYAVIVAIFAVILAEFVKIAFGSRVGFDWKLNTIVGIVIVATGALFSSLTIRVEGGRLSWHFAIPAVSNSVLLTDVVRVDVVRNPIIYGWGMHMISRGWVYNVSGRSAVEVTLKDGTRLRLGTDEPEALARAITQQGTPSSELHGANSHSSKFLRATF